MLIKSLIYQNLVTQRIFKKIENKEDLFEKIKYEAVELDETFPDYIFKNKSKFRDWIVKCLVRRIESNPYLRILKSAYSIEAIGAINTNLN